MPTEHLTRCLPAPSVTLEPRARAPYMAGAAVQTLQAWLAVLGHSVGENGHYGPVTQAAVRAVQAHYAGTLTPRGPIVANGIVGPATWCLLASLVQPRVPPPTTRAALAIAAVPVPQGVVGQPFQLALAATGGTPPYTWTITHGLLPAGLVLGTNGTILGTPTQAGSATVTVAVRDSAGHVATRTVGISVVSATASSGAGLLTRLEQLPRTLATRLHTTPTVVELGGAAAVGVLLWAATSAGKPAASGKK
jgi:hypothetical protein